MAYNAGINNQMNGGSLAGEFLTGNIDFFTIATLVPMFQTNVDTPVSLLYTQQGYSTWQPVTVVDGTGTAQTYSTQSAYQDAFNKQSNLNLLIQLFALRANPVAIGVTQATVSDPSAANGYPNYLNGTAFGSNYGSSMTVTTVKLMTEKTKLWLVTNGGDDSNADGYELLDVYNGVTTLDVTTGATGITSFVTTAGATLNTIAICDYGFNKIASTII